MEISVRWAIEDVMSDTSFERAGLRLGGEQVESESANWQRLSAAISAVVRLAEA